MGLNNIRIVMVNTSHPGNIGAASRVMKNMGLKNLVLVEPEKFPHPDATAMSAGADDVLENATIVESLSDALTGCHWVVGTTARKRKLEHQILEPRDAALQAANISHEQQIALVFGRERTGLTNEESEQCHSLVNIPTSGEHTSLNVAAAIQVLAYEFFLSHRETIQAKPSSKELPASHDEIEGYFQHLEETILKTGFLNPTQSPQLMPKLRRLYNRCQLEKNEVNILRGILSSINDYGPKQ